MLSVAIIDSNLNHINQFTKIFSTFGITDIVSAQDGAEGLRLIIDRKPDMALVNVELPTMTGFSLAFSLSLEDDLEDIIMVAVIDVMAAAVREEALSIGFNDVIGYAHAATEILNILGKYYAANT